MDYLEQVAERKRRTPDRIRPIIAGCWTIIRRVLQDTQDQRKARELERFLTLWYLRINHYHV